MVKECIVKLNNDAVTVATYDGIDVQFPSIRKDVKSVFVNYEDGKYTIVEKDYKPQSEKKQKGKKKTTKEDAANEDA